MADAKVGGVTYEELVRLQSKRSELLREYVIDVSPDIRKQLDEVNALIEKGLEEGLRTALEGEK